MLNTAFAGLRVEYRRCRLLEADAHPDPLITFAAWFDEARHAGLHEEPHREPALALARARALRS